MAARTATEQILDLQLTLRYLGIPIEGRTYLFGDNKTVVESCGLPKARLHKRHVLLSFHRVRDAVASKVLAFVHIPGVINPADVLTNTGDISKYGMFYEHYSFGKMILPILGNKA